MKRRELMNEPSDDWALAADVDPVTIIASATCRHAARSLPWSARHHAPVQSRDRVERGQNRTLLPGRNVGGVLTGEGNSPVDFAQVLVMLLARFLGPPAKAALQGPVRNR